MRYRKKPVEVDALQFDGRNAAEIAWFMGQPVLIDRDFGVGTLQIPTEEGLMTASAGDFIIKGVKGEFYPCKPDIFDLTYEAVT